MGQERRGGSWFETLRRDRALFALVGCLVLLAGTLQPLAQARASASVKAAWLICTTYGIAETSAPADQSAPPAGVPDGCPLCVAGHACGAALPVAKALPAPHPALTSPAALSRTRPVTARDTAPSSRPGEPPPSIRAPPLST